MLDEVYKLASLTAVLDGPNELVKEGANANEILIPKMTMSGLANYNKQTGYVAGDVTLEYETKKCTYDRGRMFTVDAMDNIESAGVATCYLYISAQLKGDIEDLDTTASKKVLDGWAGVIEVPEGRFYDKVTLTASGAGGFTTTGGKKIDFLIVDKNAVIQNQKHTVSKIITPDANQDADAWKFGYRTVGIAEAKDNKKVAIYVHTAAA